MLSQINANRFDGRVGSGKTWPCLLSCSAPDGDEVEVVAKFSAGCERGVGGLVAEAIVAMLAADLDLPVPEPFLVDFDDGFVELIGLIDRPLADRAAASSPIAFGSKKLPAGFALVLPDKSIPIDLRAQACEIFAFDALIQNPDRRPDNPNCLIDGRSFAIFDHELAFMTSQIIGWEPPWTVGSLEHLRRTAGRHLLFDSIKKKPQGFDRLRGAWRAVSDRRLQEYQQALPPAWAADSVTEETLDYLRQVRDHIGPALAEVERVLS